MDQEPIDTALLRRFSPLDGLRAGTLEALSQKAVLRQIPVGRPLFFAGATDKKNYYLISGDVQLRTGTTVVATLHGNTPEAQHPITPGIPRRFSAYAGTAVEVLVFDSELLDVLLTWDQTGIYDVKEISADTPVDTGDWMTILLQTKALHGLPPSNLQAIFMRLQRIPCRAGEIVIKQGDEGDYFYVITAGRCAITREDPYTGAVIKLAELEPGETFGDEALIHDGKRSATVTMLTDGALMRVDKKDFNALLTEPMVERVSYREAAEHVAKGGTRWLDVRLPSEFQSTHLAGAINMPLGKMRLDIAQLDPSVHYAIVCDTGRRSAAAAFILNSRGFHTVVVEGGIPPEGLARGQ